MHKNILFTNLIKQIRGLKQQVNTMLKLITIKMINNEVKFIQLF